MKRVLYLAPVLIFFFASCTQQWEKAADGMQYKIIKSGSGAMAKDSQFIEFHFSSVWNNGKKDSVLNDSREMMGVQIIPLDSLSIPPAYYKIFKQLRKGDSLTTRMLTDSVFKMQKDQMPPFMKFGQYLYTNVKVLNIYKNQQDADKARADGAKAAEENARKKSEALKAADDKTIKDYLAKNNIKAVRTTNGSYVEVLQAGTGANLDTTTLIKMNYTGKLLTGKMFDSNTDPSKGHVEPLIVNLTRDPMLGTGVIPGLTEALMTMNPGTKAKVYIPSGLAYGPQAGGPDLPANSNLVFDVEVLGLVSPAQAKADMQAAQQKMMDMQKRYMDSASKAQGQQPPATK